MGNGIRIDGGFRGWPDLAVRLRLSLTLDSLVFCRCILFLLISWSYNSGKHQLRASFFRGVPIIVALSDTCGGFSSVTYIYPPLQ